MLCVRWGEKYSTDYVRILRDAVARHLGCQHTFECVTSDPIAGIACVPEQCGWPGWWQKIGLFRPGFVTAPAIYLDLDMVLLRDVSWLASFALEDFAAIENWGSRRREGPMYHDELSSACMAWNGRGATNRIFENFSEADIERLHPHGDQTFITEQMRDVVTLMPQQRICSFKRHCRNGGPPAEASIVAFHGKPSPHEAGGWVQEYFHA